MRARQFPATSWTLLNKQHGFQSPEYVTRDRSVNIDAPQPEFVELKGRAGEEAVAEWKARRQMAERAGVGFEVKAKVDAGGGGSGAKGGSFAGWFAKAFNLPRNTK